MRRNHLIRPTTPYNTAGYMKTADWEPPVVDGVTQSQGEKADPRKEGSVCARGAGNFTEECTLSLNHYSPAQPSLRYEQTANFPSTPVVQNPAWYEDLKQVTIISRITIQEL